MRKGGERETEGKGGRGEGKRARGQTGRRGEEGNRERRRMREKKRAGKGRWWKEGASGYVS